MSKSEITHTGRYTVYRVDYKDTDRDLDPRGSFDSYNLAVAEAIRISQAEVAWMQIKYLKKVVWDNGGDLDDDEMPLRRRVRIKHMTAQGWLTVGDLTPEGHKFMDKVDREDLRAAQKKANEKEIIDTLQSFFKESGIAPMHILSMAAYWLTYSGSKADKAHEVVDHCMQNGRECREFEEEDDEEEAMALA